MKERAHTSRQRIESRARLGSKQLEVDREVKRVRAIHKAEYATSEQKFRQEMKRLSSAEDKKKMEEKHKAELDALKNKYNTMLDKVKPGTQVETPEGNRVTKKNMAQNAPKNVTKNATRNATRNAAQNAAKNVTSTKKAGPQEVCIEAPAGPRCYEVTTKEGKIKIVPKPR